jgi:CheY-like chemotaxis protein
VKILVVEDDENKRSQMCQFLRENITDLELLVERSLTSGLRRLRKDAPRVVLLDMTLPDYDPSPDEADAQTQIFGGREFLRQMDRFDLLVPVIVVTQFETFGKGAPAMSLSDLDRELSVDHKDTYRGVVYYHAAISGWKDRLKELLKKTVQERLPSK